MVVCDEDKTTAVAAMARAAADMFFGGDRRILDDGGRRMMCWLVIKCVRQKAYASVPIAQGSWREAKELDRTMCSSAANPQFLGFFDSRYSLFFLTSFFRRQVEVLIRGEQRKNQGKILLLSTKAQRSELDRTRSSV